MTQAIDWCAFAAYPEDTCVCRCGCEFRSHGRFVVGERPGLISPKPCPGCGKSDDLRAVRSDVETMKIG